MGGPHLPGVPVRADPRGGDGLRVRRGPEDLHSVRQVHGRTHAPARREIGRGGIGRHGRVNLYYQISDKQGRV